MLGADVGERPHDGDGRRVHVGQVLRDGEAREGAGAGRTLQVLAALGALLLHVPGEPGLRLHVPVEELLDHVADEQAAATGVALVVGPLFLTDPGDLVIGGLAGLNGGRVRPLVEHVEVVLGLALLDRERAGLLVPDAFEFDLAASLRLHGVLDVFVFLDGQVRAAVVAGLGEDALRLGA